MVAKRNVREFTLVWFESTQKWVAVLDDGTVLDNTFASVGAAHGAALETTGRGEAEWEMKSSTGDVQRYVKDDEYWVQDVTMEQLIVTPVKYQYEPAYCGGFAVLDSTKIGAEGFTAQVPTEIKAKMIVDALNSVDALIIAANTVVGCYTRNPGNFASALQVLAETAEAAREQMS